MIDTALCIVYNDSAFFHETLQQIRFFVKYIVFIVGYQTWDGRIDEIGNKEILNIIDNYLQNNNGYIIRRNSKNQAEALNYGLNFIEKKGEKEVLILDSDEIWDDKSKFNFELYIKENSKFDAFFVHANTYFKTLKWKINPPQEVNPLVMVKSHIRFKNARIANITSKKLIPKELVCLHHPSHVRSDEMMYMKIKNCFERNNVKSDWYEEIWKKWNPNIKDFHPTVPHVFHSVKEVKKEELPEILQKYM